MDLLIATRYVMTMTGTWRLKLKSSTFIQKVYNYYSVLIQTYFVCYTVALVIKLPIVWRKHKMNLVIENVEILFLVLIILYKTYVCQRKIIVDKLKFVEESRQIVHKFGQEALDTYNSYASYNKYLNIYLYIHSSLCGTTLVFSKFIEDILMQKKINNLLMNNQTAPDYDRPFPYTIWRPVDEVAHYRTAFGIDCMSAAVACTFNSITQLVFLSVMTFITAQLKIIQIRFRNFGTDENMSEKELQNNLKDIITYHKKIIMYVEDLDNALKGLLLIEFTMNSLQITSVLLQLLTLEPDINLLFRITFFAIVVVQLFLLAWNANEIKEESMKISEAIYECPWYNQSETTKHALHFIMLRAQTPMTLSVGPFFKLSNDTAVTSMKAAYSYLTILRRRIHKK